MFMLKENGGETKIQLPYHKLPTAVSQVEVSFEAHRHCSHEDSGVVILEKKCVLYTLASKMDKCFTGEMKRFLT